MHTQTQPSTLVQLQCLSAIATMKRAAEASPPGSVVPPDTVLLLLLPVQSHGHVPVLPFDLLRAEARPQRRVQYTRVDSPVEAACPRIASVAHPRIHHGITAC